MVPGRIPGMSDGRIPPGAAIGAGGGGVITRGRGSEGGGGVMNRGLGSSTGGTGVATRDRWSVSRDVSMLISPYSSSSMEAVGSDDATLCEGTCGVGAVTVPALEVAPASSASFTFSIITVVSHGFER
jgi:hypothetical protein